ncbi:hypothetical protein ncot_04565 [Nocardioides sp. JQ2195]|uniref:hypothetical protein n=1 Tax=Nocardioides sp. JQ2195 TaxID=2592334 RepID=UPI00143E8A02|nr:hypothetical protein [Nocardioides sp. JQ2195]QIX25953.1 hypothetical protein ncot_04565 [Nocardioides sp. JQ2195]
MTPHLPTAPLPQHMGQLHPYENFLVLAIAFGPFLVLGIVVFFVRRRDLAEADPAGASAEREDSAQTDVAQDESPEGDPVSPSAATAVSDQPDRESGLSPGRPPAS